jgi:hypothetical protein
MADDKNTRVLRDVACDQKFLERLVSYRDRGLYVHMTPNVPDRYAPKVFAHNSSFSEAEFCRAMRRLWATGRIKLETYGPPSRQRRCLAIGLRTRGPVTWR